MADLFDRIHESAGDIFDRIHGIVGMEKLGKLPGPAADPNTNAITLKGQRPGESRLDYLHRVANNNPAAADTAATMEADRQIFRDIGAGAKEAATGTTGERKAHGASQAIRGTVKLGAKILPAVAPMNPVGTAVGVGAGIVGQQAVEKGLEAAGAPEGYRELAGDVAGLAAGGAAGKAANGRATKTKYEGGASKPSGIGNAVGIIYDAARMVVNPTPHRAISLTARIGRAIEQMKGQEVSGPSVALDPYEAAKPLTDDPYTRPRPAAPLEPPPPAQSRELRSAPSASAPRPSGELAPGDYYAPKEASPGEALARAQGLDYAKLSAEDRAMLDAVAKAQANVARQQPVGPRQPVATQTTPPEAVPVQSATGKTVSDLLREELEAKRPAQVEPPVPPPAPPATKRGGPPRKSALVDPYGRPIYVRSVPTAPGRTTVEVPAVSSEQAVTPKPTLAAQPEVPPRQEVIPPQPEAAVEPPVKKQSLAQTEAAAQSPKAVSKPKAKRPEPQGSIRDESWDKDYVEKTNAKLREREQSAWDEVAVGKVKAAAEEGKSSGEWAVQNERSYQDIYGRPMTPAERAADFERSFKSFTHPDGYESNWDKFSPARQAEIRKAFAEAYGWREPASTPSSPNPTGKPSLAQTEAAMARKAPPPFDPEGARSPVHANGETKSPQFRAQERVNGNIEAKASRWAQALHEAGVSAQEAKQIPGGRVSVDQIAKGATPGWGNITDSLVESGFLSKGEMPPNQSVPMIIRQLKKLEADKIARELADEMKSSGTWSGK